jgi:hypothetical protein
MPLRSQTERLLSAQVLLRCLVLDADEKNAGAFLGVVIAHELGHVLLPPATRTSA